VNIDELLRYAAPSRMQLRRSAAGETIMLDLASANRDLRCSRTRTFTIRLRVFLSGSRGRIITYESAPSIALRSIRSLVIDFSTDEATAPNQDRPPRSSRGS
jgi:hypothetical protein